MSRLVLALVLSACLYASCEDAPATLPGGKESAREEKLRSGLIDAFQNIKKGSAKGGLDDEGPLNADLIGSISSPNTSREKTEDNFDLFADDDGLTFADAFEHDAPEERKISSTEKSHNVQHIVKMAKQDTKALKPKLDSIISKITDSIRTTINESRNMNAKRESAELVVPTLGNVTFVGIENMLRVFDAEVLVEQWPRLRREVAGECRDQLQLYVEGLNAKKLWAMKSKFDTPFTLVRYVSH